MHMNDGYLTLRFVLIFIFNFDKPLVRTVFSPVTCRSLIRCVLHNLQGRTNNASEGGVSQCPLSDA
jgi:hypothetical protein